VCVNHICINYSPLKDESTVLEEGDVAKIDLGCHIDGFFSHIGTTIIVRADKSTPAEGPLANLVVAGHTALQAGIRTLIEGKSNEDVTKVIADVAD
jgi:curved DNA binding protein